MKPVSSESERLILVDADDRVVGYETKARCHDGEGILHRAFSIFVFNSRGELLLQQRHASKRLWPAFWSNSCCSHPREGEELLAAAHRRLGQELGLACELTLLYRFTYQARFRELGSEHELCAVLVGTTDAPPRPHPEEIAALRWAPAATLADELARNPDPYTPWFKLEWERLTRDFADRLPR